VVVAVLAGKMEAMRTVLEEVVKVVELVVTAATLLGGGGDNDSGSDEGATGDVILLNKSVYVLVFNE
jgi:hypothetical protein